MRSRLISVTLAAALALTVAACSDDDGGDEASTRATSATTAPTTTPTTTPTTAAPGTTAGGGTGTTAATGSTRTTLEAPDVLGVQVADGLEYPNPTTCQDAEALYERLLQNDAAGVEGALWGKQGYWLAIDSTSASADVFIPEGAPERISVKFRGGVLDYNGDVLDGELPVLSPQVTYAYVSVSGDGTVTCEEGQAVG